MGILDRIAKILNPPPPQKPSTPPSLVDPKKKFQIKTKGMTLQEFRNWMYKDPDVLKQVLKNSPSRREMMLQLFQSYLPQGIWSIRELTIREMRKKVERDIMFGENFEIQKRARELKPLLDLFEKKFLK